jgi:formyltetrahydrofolate-dependent phosphoribosylglycinamide formyltransferase
VAVDVVNLALLISGSGRTLQNFVDVIAAGRLDARIRVVVSSSKSIAGNDRAVRAGLPLEVVERKAFKTPAEFSDAVTSAVERHGPVDLILLAGFLHLYTFPDRWKGRVMNIHPALLPKFGGKGMYGHHVHEAVIKSGEKESGCTVHFADLRYDRGPIVLQKRVPVVAGDTPDKLAARVFAAECEAYPEAVRLFAAGKLTPVPGPA